MERLSLVNNNRLSLIEDTVFKEINVICSGIAPYLIGNFIDWPRVALILKIKKAQYATSDKFEEYYKHHLNKYKQKKHPHLQDEPSFIKSHIEAEQEELHKFMNVSPGLFNEFQRHNNATFDELKVDIELPTIDWFAEHVKKYLEYCKDKLPLTDTDIEESINKAESTARKLVDVFEKNYLKEIKNFSYKKRLVTIEADKDSYAENYNKNKKDIYDVSNIESLKAYLKHLKDKIPIPSTIHTQPDQSLKKKLTFILQVQFSLHYKIEFLKSLINNENHIPAGSAAISNSKTIKIFGIDKDSEMQVFYEETNGVLFNKCNLSDYYDCFGQLEAPAVKLDFIFGQVQVFGFFIKKLEEIINTDVLNSYNQWIYERFSRNGKEIKREVIPSYKTRYKEREISEYQRNKIKKALERLHTPTKHPKNKLNTSI